MGQKTKGGMWCPACDTPVMGVKNMHRVRNTASVGLAPATAGLSLLGSKAEGYVCPTCGGRTRRKKWDDGRSVTAEEKAKHHRHARLAWGIVLTLIAVIDAAAGTPEGLVLLVPGIPLLLSGLRHRTKPGSSVPGSRFPGGS